MTPDQRDAHEHIVARGHRARTIFEDPMVREALEAMKAGTRDAFFDLPPEAADKREFLHLMDRARQQFERVFILLINDAEVSGAELLEEQHAQARVEAIHRRAANA